VRVHRFQIVTCVATTWVLFAAATPLAAAFPRLHRGKFPPDLAEILAHMDDSSKRLKTLSAKLEYTKVTVLVDDKSTESGEIFFHKSKNPEILINIQKPDSKTILFKKNRAEIYIPKINQIQEYDLDQHSELVQRFLLLGFGKESGDLSGDLKKDYDLKLIGEEEIDGDTTAILELIPRREDIAAHLGKVDLWVSEESWFPVQQKFFEPGGDYLVARYTGVKVNRAIPASTFQLQADENAKRVRVH
jgi:outer membrane lipoprotein-sorting protein